jgi:hypothetical protein
MPHDNSPSPIFDVRDADTCDVVSSGPVQSGTTKRGVADDVSPKWDGAEVWTNTSNGIASATTGAVVDTATTSFQNFLIYWDADESRELEDGTTIMKFGGAVLQNCPSCASDLWTGASGRPRLARRRRPVPAIRGSGHLSPGGESEFHRPPRLSFSRSPPTSKILAASVFTRSSSSTRPTCSTRTCPRPNRAMRRRYGSCRMARSWPATSNATKAGSWFSPRKSTRVRSG